MSSARYTALPSPRSAPDAGRELDDAFESENDDDGNTESTPLANHTQSRDAGLPETDNTTSSIPGAYDFERDYDYPPPGSPPRPSAVALPNDYGNSNGQVPTSPVRISAPRPSFFRRAVGAVLPTHYARVPTESQSTRTRGGGIENDGVFANVMAKPQRARVVRTADGDTHLVPEEVQKEAPPSYADAQADSVPPYWETTVHAPAGLDPSADMIIDDLRSGSFWIFGLNLFISFFFQFIGFLLTYLLHTSHAAKYGSRAGLGLTLIQYGFYSRAMQNSSDLLDVLTGESEAAGWNNPSTDYIEPPTSSTPQDASPISGVTSRDWLSFLLMTLGWFLLLSSIVGYWRVKRWENSIRAANPTHVITPQDIERDIAIRRNIENVFGLGFQEEDDSSAAAEARLTRDLRAAGLI